MSKFSKKSLAALTAAAIMASTASVVSYAATATVPAGLTVLINGEVGDLTDLGKNDVLTWTVPKGKIVKLTSGGDEVDVSSGSYKVATNSETLEFTLEDDPNAPAGGGATDPGEENFDQVVWVNGKDTKANTKVTPATPASLYKTETYDQVMMSAGGKWQVAVTDTTIDTPEKFAALVVEGKFDKTTATKSKEFATAKIKDGTVTVTAGKKAGNVKVWVYEIKNKSIVATEVKDNAFFEKLDDSVMPMDRDFEVKVAPTMVTTTKATTVKDGTIEAISSAEKLAKDYAAGSEVVVYFGDKKAAASLDATYVLWDGKNKKALELNADGKYVKEGEYTAELVDATETAGPAVKITIDAKATNATKIDVQVRNVESQKIAKIAPKVKKAEAVKAADEVTVTIDATVTVKNGADEVKTGDKVKKDATLTITPVTATDVVSINGTAQEKAGEVTYKVTGLETDAKLTIAAAAPAAE